MTNKLLSLPNGKGELFWRRLTTNDFDAMKEMVTEQFMKREPLSVALQLPLEDAVVGFVEHSKACIIDGHSLCAYDPDNRIVGMFINSGPHTAKKSSNNWGEGLDLPLKMAQLFRTLEFMSKGPDKAVATKAGEAKFMKGEYLMVHEDYFRMGIGEALCTKSFEVAKEQGCKYFFAECTSTFTTKIFNKHGGESLKEVPYSEYRDRVSNERVLTKYPEPHSLATLICKEL